MLHQGLLPAGITYSALVIACEKGALQQRAFLSQNPLISAYDQGKQLRPALNVCEVMLRDGVPLDVVSYGAVISACEKCKEMRRALNVCDAMLRHGIKPNIVSYNVLINAK